MPIPCHIRKLSVNKCCFLTFPMQNSPVFAVLVGDVLRFDFTVCSHRSPVLCYNIAIEFCGRRPHETNFCDAFPAAGGSDGLFGLRLAEAELVALAAELGSDTAFFVRNTPQLCTGRGEIMEPYPLCLAGMTLVVVKPDVGVSTREAYAGVRPHVPEVPLAERLRRPVVEWQGLVTNDFEPHIFAAHPAIREARDSLLAAGAVYASMSGSGSAVFGLFDDAQKAGNLRLQTPFVYTL